MSKYGQIAGTLKSRIIDGTYPPGTPMPSQHDLIEEFNVARPTAVQALRVLRNEGWITTAQGRNSIVKGRPRDVTPSSLTDGIRAYADVLDRFASELRKLADDLDDR